MATAARKKSPAYEAGVREGGAMSKRPRKGAKVESEISPETEEETEYPENEEELDSAKGRKRDGSYGKKLMDAPCSCGKKRGKAKCDGSCGKKMDRHDALTPQEYLSACELGIQGRSRSYIRARLDTTERLDLKCGKGAISKGEKCHKGPATKAQGPSAGVQIGQTAKGVGRGVLEAGKWASGYNIGKTLATGITRGKNEKASGGAKAASVVGSTLLLGLPGGLGAARRVGAFGMTDLQQHAQNEQKEKKWRRSVGYRDGGTYAKGFGVDYAQLGM